MRSQTPSYVVNVKLHLPEAVKAYLEKSFRIANSAYNEALSFGLRRFDAMKGNPTYQALLVERQNCSDKTHKKNIDQSLTQLRKDYSLTEYGLSNQLSRQRRVPGSAYRHLNSGELQVIAGQAYQTLEKVLFYQVKAHRVKFRSKYNPKMSFRNRVNTTGTRLVPSERKGYAYRLFLHKTSTFVDIPVKAFTPYQQLSLMRSDRIKYVQVIRQTIRGKRVYTLQIICEGYPYAKISKGTGVLGIDPGVSTLAYVSPTEVALVDLVPEQVNRQERLIRSLERRIERSRRVNQPELYHADGAIQKGVKFKPLSKRAQRLQVRRQRAYRSLSEERRKIHGSLINHLLSQASLIKMEDLSIKGLQRRSRELRINPKTNRPFSKKRFGKSIFRAAPGIFKQALLTKASQLGVEVQVISPQHLKPSQYNHLTGTFEKKPLSARLFDLSPEWTGVQRDLYSAFLIQHVEQGVYQEEALASECPHFYHLMTQFLQAPIQTSRLAWYLR
jgi:putative IS transposase